MKKIFGSITAIVLLTIGIATTADAGRNIGYKNINDGSRCTGTLHVWVTRNRAYGQTHVNCTKTMQTIFPVHLLQKQGDWGSSRGYGASLRNNVRSHSATSSVQCIGNTRSMWGINPKAVGVTDSNGSFQRILTYNRWLSVNNLNCS